MTERLSHLPSANPQITVSWGELFDRISISEIRLDKLGVTPEAPLLSRERDLLVGQLEQLRPFCPELIALIDELVLVNRALWEIEDELRIRESESAFDDAFILLARNVYLYNDRRASVKMKINQLTNSFNTEMKIYSRR